jgi:hypothetical protein
VREREVKTRAGVLRDTNFKGRGKRNILSFKVPSQYLLVLLVKYVGEKVKRWEVGLCYEQREEVEQGLYCF